AAVHLAQHARADIRRIDTAAAAAIPGVVRVFTAADVPGALRVGIIHTDWPIFIPEGGRTSYVGDVLAALQSAAHTVHEVFQTQRIEHAFLEPESTLAVIRDDEGIHVYSGGQGVWD